MSFNVLFTNKSRKISKEFSSTISKETEAGPWQGITHLQCCFLWKSVKRAWRSSSLGRMRDITDTLQSVQGEASWGPGIRGMGFVLCLRTNSVRQVWSAVNVHRTVSLSWKISVHFLFNQLNNTFKNNYRFFYPCSLLGHLFMIMPFLSTVWHVVYPFKNTLIRWHCYSKLYTFTEHKLIGFRHM